MKGLHLAEIRAERLDEMKAKTTPGDRDRRLPRAARADRDIDAVYISATPESTHYPMAKDFLDAGKHVFLEKPIAIELARSG